MEKMSRTSIKKIIRYVNDKQGYLTQSKQGHGICLKKNDTETEIQRIRSSYQVKLGAGG